MSNADTRADEAGYVLLGLVSLATVTSLYFWLDAPLAAAAFTYLVVLVLLSLVSNLYSLSVLSFIGACCLSYFFAYPTYSFRVDYLQDIITISAFVITSFVVNFLVTRVRLEQRDHMRTCETLREANQRLEVTNKALWIENVERKRTEETLRESEYKFRQIFDTVPGLTWSTDSDGSKAKKAEEQPRSAAQLQATLNVIPAYTWYAAPSGGLTFVNKRTADYLGLPEDHPLRFGIDIGAPWDAHIPLLHPDDREESRKAWSTCLRTGEAAEFSQRVPNAQGDYRWFLSRAEPLRASDGTLLNWVGVNLEIEELKRAEQASRESEEKLRRIVQAVPGLLWVMGIDGETIQLNQRVLDYTGRRFEDFQRSGWKENLHPDDALETEAAFYHAIQTGTSHNVVHRVRRSDGEYRWHHSRAEPIRDRQGRIVEWYGLSIEIDDRMKAEEALRRSEYSLQKIIETVPGLLWSNAPDGEPTHINQRMLDYSGMPFEDFKRRGWEAFVHPADYPETEKAFFHAIQTGTSYEGVMRLRRADGEFRWHHARCEPLRDQQGRVIQWYGLSVDIDERKKAEDLLRRGEAHLAEAQRLSNTGSAVYNDTTILYWSDETYRIMGFDPRKGLPEREASDQRLHPEDRVRARKEARRAEQQKRDYTLEYRILLPSGTIKHIELSAHPKFSTSGELVEIMSTLVDVTGRKHAEQALRESEGKFRDYAETASDWFWEIGPDYKFTLLTENALGSRPADRIGTACWDHALDLETEPEKWRLIRETLDSRKPFRDFVYCSTSRDGSPMYVRASGKPVFDSNGGFRGYRGTGTDVTAIMRAHRVEASLRTVQAELAHVSRVTTLGQLTASIAHEITQPLATARNNARAAVNFLHKQPPDLGEVREALNCIVADADRAGDIIDRIRDHIRKAPPRSDRFDLNTAINEVIVLARGEITKNGVSVHTHLTEELLPINGDRVQLQQVIMNLILNAVEAMSSVEAGARELLISTEQNQAIGVLVAVRDSGPGIDPEHFERVFEAFHTTKSSGVGIGLSICRSIIEAHGGRLWAEANEPRGAAFKFTLTSADAFNSQRDQPKAASPPPILVRCSNETVLTPSGLW